MMFRNLAALASVVLVAACSQQLGAVYPVPIAEARQTLKTTELPPLVFGSDPPTVTVQADSDTEVVWIARRDDAELFRYVAHLAEDGAAATRVRLELKGAEGDIARKLEEHPQIRDLYLVAMTERVASTLEHRAFDMSRIYPQMAAAMVSNMGALNASADAAAAASEKLAHENIDKAYRDEAAGIRR